MNHDQKRKVLSVFFGPWRGLMGTPVDAHLTGDRDRLRRALVYCFGTAQFPEQILLVWLANLGRIGMLDRTALAMLLAPRTHAEGARDWMVGALALARAGLPPIRHPFREEVGCLSCSGREAHRSQRCSWERARTGGFVPPSEIARDGTRTHHPPPGGCAPHTAR